MKKMYISPNFQMITVQTEDVITASGGGTSNNITNAGSGTGIQEGFGDFIGSLQ